MKLAKYKNYFLCGYWRPGASDQGVVSVVKVLNTNTYVSIRLWVNVEMQEQNGQYLPVNISKCISSNKCVWIYAKISLGLYLLKYAVVRV